MAAPLLLMAAAGAGGAAYSGHQERKAVKQQTAMADAQAQRDARIADAAAGTDDGMNAGQRLIRSAGYGQNPNKAKSFLLSL